MPRADDPRIMVRFTPEGHASVKAAADSAGVSIGGLVRECAERHAVEVARLIGDGKVRVRRNSAPPARGPVRVDTPSEAQRWALERQRRLNAAKERGT